MKKLYAVVFMTTFAVAVCHAVPYSAGLNHPSTELSKKHFELSMAEVPAMFEMPKAPEVVYDLVEKECEQSYKIVLPQANGPPGHGA
jgi:hypothetical protein